MTFEEYENEQYRKAQLKSDFDINGNSPRAMYHQSFIKRVKLSAFYLCREIKEVVHKNPIEYTVGHLISLIIVVPYYLSL